MSVCGCKIQRMDVFFDGLFGDRYSEVCRLRSTESTRTCFSTWISITSIMLSEANYVFLAVPTLVLVGRL